MTVLDSFSSALDSFVDIWILFNLFGFFFEVFSLLLDTFNSTRPPFRVLLGLGLARLDSIFDGFGFFLHVLDSFYPVWLLFGCFLSSFRYI